ncbi:acylphosphatase [Desulfonatronum sp. SC1]|uniref:acylphosphatase n=1 Tax=Desulfonatronum sp. SC1 TaxID=2109626 RepID=UPI000D2FE6AA|nr:acylphosphatase [Desulfonatronum sp. SC1]PTN36865.1 acylphosphatase [Desulfonatronum sp. SC1]
MNILHAHVSGRVQGVYFRGWTRSQAQRLGLSGWVRNLRDGQVEVLAQGDETALRELEKLLWKGPSFSRVDDVAVSTVPDEGPTLEGFHIAPTV